MVVVSTKWIVSFMMSSCVGFCTHQLISFSAYAKLFDQLGCSLASLNDNVVFGSDIYLPCDRG